eukprot:CAMPEP_0174889448 /NCGR_PEP_ID=MMETSP0167-20121228/4704_1 /TAXON_ID=38298 /ORGANISM="Rhodella maculata, Strain CCMP736" /LENGTH=145 /DNA_ID=CAMNT_0016126855 /DNA_START=738 /DNA_END=1171 /DNA_ORIENTATION=-
MKSFAAARVIRVAKPGLPDGPLSVANQRSSSSPSHGFSSPPENVTSNRPPPASRHFPKFTSDPRIGRPSTGASPSPGLLKTSNRISKLYVIQPSPSLPGDPTSLTTSSSASGNSTGSNILNASFPSVTLGLSSPASSTSPRSSTG